MAAELGGDDDSEEETEIIVSTNHQSASQSVGKTSSFRQQILRDIDSSDDEDEGNVISNIRSRGLKSISTSLYMDPSKNSKHISEAKANEIQSFGIEKDISAVSEPTPISSVLKSLLPIQNSARTPTTDSSLEISQLREILNTTCRRGESSQIFYIEREKRALNRFAPIYRLYRERPQADHNNGHFLLSAKNRVIGSKTSNYIISGDYTPDDKGSQAIIGKVRSNWSGSSYVCFDHGLSAENCVDPSLIRNEIAAVGFEYDDTGPGKLKVVVPRILSNGRAFVWKDENRTKSESGGKNSKESEIDNDSLTSGSDCSTSLVSMIHSGHANAMSLINKRPRWDDKYQGHVLNFRGRVTMSSVKNFQLICDEVSSDEVALQFGRVKKETFTLDVGYPLSPLQGFCICIASLDRKFADGRGFEVAKKLSNAMKWGRDSDDDNA